VPGGRRAQFALHAPAVLGMPAGSGQSRGAVPAGVIDDVYVKELKCSLPIEPTSWSA
jgi:hypothetical protein